MSKFLIYQPLSVTMLTLIETLNNSNQKHFKEAMYSALCALCQNGQLSPCEMMLFTGFRDGNDNLVSYK